MEDLKCDFDKECEEVVDEVAQKFKYNDELKSVLSKIAKAALNGRTYEEKQLFYKMLRTTPILVVPHNTTISHEEIVERMIGDVNPHIKDKSTVDNGEYDKQESAGAFVTAPIIDENLNLVGVKKFLYITEFDRSEDNLDVSPEYFERFQTAINVPHLIHELGHAWVAEANPYTIENGILTQRMGTVESKYKITELGNGQYESEGISTTGTFIEEGLNTNFEEETVAKFLGISLEEVQELYSNGTITPSFYQPGMAKMTELMATLSKGDFAKWRIFGNKDSLERINETFSKANFYEKREKLYFRNEMTEGNPEEDIIVARNMLFNEPKGSEEAVKIMQNIEEDFFPDSSEMTPMQMMDNILMQYYDMNANRYHLGIDNYTQMLKVISREGYGFINQTIQIQGQEKGKNESVK